MMIQLPKRTLQVVPTKLELPLLVTAVEFVLVIIFWQNTLVMSKLISPGFLIHLLTGCVGNPASIVLVGLTMVFALTS